MISVRPVRRLGTVSYGLFLWHLIVLEAIYLIEDRPTFTGDPVSTFLMTLVGGVVLASISYYLLERPIQPVGFWLAKAKEGRRWTATTSRRPEAQRHAARSRDICPQRSAKARRRRARRCLEARTPSHVGPGESDDALCAAVG